MTERDTYRPDIDGLRAVAVGAVVAYHAFPARVPGGFVGVDIFFVISGFLISGIILGAIRAERFSFRRFYARRIRRIFPALILVLAATLAAGWFVMFADDYAILGRHVAAGAGMVSNLALWAEAGYFDVAADTKPLLHLWSLGIEEQFYLVWPLMLLASSRWASGPITLIAGLGAISFAWAITIVDSDRTAAFYAPWGRFWELLLGALLGAMAYHDRIGRRLEGLVAHRGVADLLAVLGITLIATAVTLIGPDAVFPGTWALLPTVGTALLIGAGPAAWINRRALSVRPLVWVGLISYPLYLWHWPLLSLARIAHAATPPATIRLLLVTIAILLAWLTYRLVEWPIRRSPPRRAVVTGLTMAMTATAAVGVTTVLTAGFSGRNIDLSEEARFVQFYEHLRRDGLSAPYRAECDFMDWKAAPNRASLDPGCLTPGRDQTFLLWGDSFAQSLSPGMRENLPPGTRLAQIATSACHVAVDNLDDRINGRCRSANSLAMQTIQRVQPAIVIIAQRDRHLATDWQRLVSRVLELGARRVLIVGPLPEWQPTLPLVYARRFLRERPAYVSVGLERSLFDVDRQLGAMVRPLPGATYVSLLERLCESDKGCLARVPGGRDFDLMAVDFGHLSPRGSSFVGREVFAPYFRAMSVDPSNRSQ